MRIRRIEIIDSDIYYKYGKLDPTQYNYETHKIEVSSDYDIDNDILGWIVHENVHYKLDKENFIDNGLPYPYNDVEKYAYIEQFKYLINNGVTLEYFFDNAKNKLRYKDILSHYYNIANEQNYLKESKGNNKIIKFDEKKIREISKGTIYEDIFNNISKYFYKGLYFKGGVSRDFLLLLTGQKTKDEVNFRDIDFIEFYYNYDIHNNSYKFFDEYFSSLNIHEITYCDYDTDRYVTNDNNKSLDFFIKKYMTSRDVSINECLLSPTEFICTLDAYNSAKTKQLKNKETYSLRLFLRSVLFCAINNMHMPTYFDKYLEKIRYEIGSDGFDVWLFCIKIIESDNYKAFDLLKKYVDIDTDFNKFYLETAYHEGRLDVYDKSVLDSLDTADVSYLFDIIYNYGVNNGYNNKNSLRYEGFMDSINFLNDYLNKRSDYYGKSNKIPFDKKTDTSMLDMEYYEYEKLYS